jgi:predicted secreted protein
MTARVLLPLLLLSSAPALAHDQSKLEVLGFSPDGKLAAIVESALLDGSGLPWARAAVLDVARNAFVGKPFEVGPDAQHPQLEGILEEARRAVDPVARKLGFAAWEPGQAAAVDAGGQLLLEGKPLGKLELKQRPWTGKAPKTCANAMGGSSSPVVATLTLVQGKRRQVLNADKAPPASRLCPLGYALGGAWVKGKALVVDLRYTRPGFEGQDTRSIPVSARVAKLP